MLGEVEEFRFVGVGVVELGGDDGRGDLVGGRIVPETIDIKVVGEEIALDMDRDAVVGAGGDIGEELRVALRIAVDADTEAVGRGAARERPAEGETRAVEVDTRRLENLQRALRDLQPIGVEDSIVAEGVVVDVLDEGRTSVEPLDGLLIADLVGAVEDGSDGVGRREASAVGRLQLRARIAYVGRASADALLSADDIIDERTKLSVEFRG